MFIFNFPLILLFEIYSVFFPLFVDSFISFMSIQIIHSSEGISKNYPHEVPMEQSSRVYKDCFEGTECG